MTLIANDKKTGILLVDKQRGRTAFYLIKVLRKLSSIKKVGHAGTLDPFATGVMILLIGKDFTKLSDQFMGLDKEYIATLHLGEETTTYDLDGDIVNSSDIVPTKNQLDEKLQDFQGDFEQIPPMFSAKKVDGKKLYDLARKGIEIERKPCKINAETTLLEYSYPKVVLKIKCSKGTYIRSIAHDLGKKLGCFAHLKELVRTRVGNYHLEDCIKGDDLVSGKADYTSFLQEYEDSNIS